VAVDSTEAAPLLLNFCVRVDGELVGLPLAELREADLEKSNSLDRLEGSDCIEGCLYSRLAFDWLDLPLSWLVSCLHDVGCHGKS
jgi:hypothetical protein